MATLQQTRHPLVALPGQGAPAQRGLELLEAAIQHEMEYHPVVAGFGPCSVCRWAPSGCQGFQGGGNSCNSCGHDFALHL
jgi:hypothetical protein